MAATQQQLADFHGVSKSAVKQWSQQKRHEKKVQLIAGVDLKAAALIGEISQLVYIYNCKHDDGVEKTKIAYFQVDWDKVSFGSNFLLLDTALCSANCLEILIKIREALKNEIY